MESFPLSVNVMVVVLSWPALSMLDLSMTSSGIDIT